MSIFENNFAVLQELHPALAKGVASFSDKHSLRVFKAADGGVAYGLQTGKGLAPLTDHIKPLDRINRQLDQFSAQLQDFSKPVLIIGAYPGNEILFVFDLSEKVKTPHCAQPIWICVDSWACFTAFLQTWDVTRVLQSPRVVFFTPDAAPAKAQWLREHPEFPHAFTLISGAADRVLHTIAPPFADLVVEREKAIPRICAENDRYYDALDDATLAAILAGQGGRPPRLLMPTVSWSTFIQYSARDTCAAFEQMGWQTRLLKVEAMITPYYLARQIAEFKPDLFLFIDHMRYEAEELYPRNLLLATWIQDDLPHLQCRKAGEKLRAYAARRRDVVFGGNTRELCEEYGYPPERTFPLQVSASPAVFHPVEPTAAERQAYGCDLAFATNTSMPSERVLEERIQPIVEPWGISAPTLEAIHDYLWQCYRSGRVWTHREALLQELLRYPEFAQACAAGHQDELGRLFFWRLNDTIYRHVVLEWADERGVALHLYGRGWEQHPRFRKYARGPLEHGPILNLAYQCARLNLHLNASPGMHQRLWEILAAGARPLLRAAAPPEPADATAPMRALAQVLLGRQVLSSLPAALQSHLQNHVFEVAQALANATDPKSRTPEALGALVMEQLDAQILNHPEWLVPDFEKYTFHDKRSFHERLATLLRE